MSDNTLRSEKQEFRRLEVSFQRVLRTCALLVCLVAVMLIGLIAQRSANQASDQSKAACSAYYYISNSPISPGTTPLGLHISAGLRVAYYKAHCNLGPLNPPDPRVVPFLPKGIK